MVTNAEYQKANNAVNSQYTADSLQNYQNAYNDYMSQWMSSKEAVNKAKGLLVERGNSQWTATTSTYQNQWAGNYVYNEKTWYYENQTDTSRNTTNQWLTPRPENVKSETPIKQEEKVVTTDTWIKQEWKLTPLSKEYYSQTSDEAQNTIRNNLNWYRQTNPELFSDYETFKKNFSYDARDDVQKQTLDNWYMWYTKWLELSNIPTNELYTQYKDWQVSISDLENLRVSNPTKYAELQATINKWNIISAYDDTPSSSTNSIQDMAYQMMMQTFNNFMNWDSSSWASNIFREYEGKMNDPEMTGLSDKCTEVKEEMENIQSDIDSMKKQVEAEYEWTWASRSKINAIISDRTYDLQLQLRTLNSEYNKYAAQYNNRMQQYQNEFTMQIQEYQLNQQERQYQMKELGFALDLMNFETNDQRQEREWNYRVRQQEYQNWNINSSDYQTRYKAALTSVQNLLSQYEWIPMVRSAEQMAQDVLKAIDGGSDLGTELTKINQQIQQKDEYKILYNQTFGTSSQWFGKTVKIWDTDYVEYNWQLYTAEDFNKKFWNAISVSPETMNQWLETFKTKMQSLVATWWAIRQWWCGEPVNDYLKSIWSNVQYDNDLQTKLDSITPWAWPKVWSIAIWDWSSFNSPDAKKYGHVAIVTWVDEKNWTITVLESNWQAHKMGMGYWKYNMANVTWYYDPTAWYSTSETTTKSVWGLSDKQLTQLAKDYINWEKTYADIKATYWEDVLNAVGLRAANLADEWYEKSTKITDPAKQASMEEKLRKEYDKAVSDAQETIDWVNKMDDAYKLVDTDLNAASQALVIAYNKILDSWSVVREWEYARTAEWQSKLKQIEAKLEQLTKWWAWITKDELASLVKVAKVFSENAVKTQKDAAERTMVSINKYGLTPEAVLPLSALNQINNPTTTSTKTTTTSWKWKQFKFSKFDTNTTSSNSIESSNFYQTYANTAPASNSDYTWNGYTIQWNSNQK